DMGMPRRVLNVIFHPRPNSILFWDAMVLTGYFTLNLLISSTSLYYEHRREHHPGWLKPFVYLSIPWAISIHTVTAFLYAGLPGRHFWLTAIMAPRFLASAFAAGPAFLILCLYVVRRVSRFDPGERAIRTLAKIVTYAMVTNVFFLLLEVFTAFYSQIPGHMTPFVYLFSGLEGHGRLVPFMRLSVVLAVVSVALLIPSRTRNNPTTLAIACASLFVSLLLEKGFGLIVGGFVPNPLERVVEYWPTLPETVITLGIWAIGLLILTVGYKIALAVREEELAEAV
ncbi:MAG: menaquinol oxidoreductase, partial [Nitrospirae bacterium]